MEGTAGAKAGSRGWPQQQSRGPCEAARSERSDHPRQRLGLRSWSSVSAAQACSGRLGEECGWVGCKIPTATTPVSLGLAPQASGAGGRRLPGVR